MTFRPEHNLGLVALRKAWPERDDRDKPDYIADFIDGDGTVYVRPLTIRDVLVWAERYTDDMA